MSAPERSFADRYGPWAVVLGAAAGIGAAFATELARRGCDLVLADRDAATLAATAAAIEAAEPVQVRTEVVDLADAAALDALLARLGEIDVGLAVYNAALGHVGAFAHQPPATSEAQVDLNVRGPVAVAHAMVGRLRARGSGGLVLLSSMSAMRGAPMVATYAATKAFNLVLAEGLWEELRHDGVDVLAVLPGTTRTPGLLGSAPTASAGTEGMLEPDQVVTEALAVLGTEPSVIVGEANRAGEAMLAGMPRRDAVDVMGRIMRQMYPGADPDHGPDPG